MKESKRNEVIFVCENGETVSFEQYTELKKTYQDLLQRYEELKQIELIQKKDIIT